jgi:hypothetical protein
MTATSLDGQQVQSEVVPAAAEGLDANMNSKAEPIHPVVSRTSIRPHRIADEEGDSYTVMDKDVEKAVEVGSISTTDEPVDIETDPNVVDYNGPDDPENPLNWAHRKKWGMVSLISAITFLTPLASSIFAPGVPEIMTEFNSTNDMLAGFMISVYVLGVSCVATCQSSLMLISV